MRFGILSSFFAFTNQIHNDFICLRIINNLFNTYARTLGRRDPIQVAMVGSSNTQILNIHKSLQRRTTSTQVFFSRLALFRRGGGLNAGTLIVYFCYRVVNTLT